MLSGSEQEKDLTEPVNCDGVGRIRHFRRGSGDGWPSNPLPIDPACRALGLGQQSEVLAQVFQNAGCNWRCWYCFVPFSHLSANEKHGRWCSAAELVEAYSSLEQRPPIIDLTGGQPDLVPEWVPWMMKELQVCGLDQEVFLWSDDNLSGDYFWSILSDADRDLVRSYDKYARVACFKGYDAESFTFNTLAQPEEFDRQFERFEKYVDFGLDIYAYVTFTNPSDERLTEKITLFVDRLQRIHELLPLRTVPLEIRMYTPVESRGVKPEMTKAMNVQYDAVSAWDDVLTSRFTQKEREMSICDVRLNR